MGLWDIAINNLKRRKGKTLLIIIGISIGIATLVTLFSLTTAMNNKLNGDLEKMGTKVLITPQSEKTSFSYGGIVVAQDVVFDIKTMSPNILNLLEAKTKELNIKEIAPKKVEAVDLNGHQTLLVGMDINREFTLKPWLKVQGTMPDKEGQILLGSNLARQMAKGLGDTVLINNQELIISGFLEETGQEEDNIILVPLVSVERLSGNNNLSLVEIIFNNNPNINDDIAKLKAIIPGEKITTAKEMMESRKEVIESFGNFAILISIIVLIILVLIVITTMLGVINEQVKEIGIFRAIGFRKKDIMHIIFLEAALACTLGGVVGYFLGIFTAKGVAPMIEAELLIGWNPVLGIFMLTISVIIGLTASWFPAVKVVRLDPQDALRYL